MKFELGIPFLFFLFIEVREHDFLPVFPHCVGDLLRIKVIKKQNSTKLEFYKNPIVILWGEKSCIIARTIVFLMTRIKS